jgi:hypothetical protein
LTTFVVNTLVDDASGEMDGLVSLREAIVASNNNMAFGDAVAGETDGDRIVFDASLSGGSIVLTQGQLSVLDDLVIEGGGREIAIDGDGSTRIFDLRSTELVAINNLELTNGFAFEGGAISATGLGTTRLFNVSVTDNTATGFGGGAIFFSNGNLFASGLQASGNAARSEFADGGAIYQVGGRIGLFDSVIEANEATNTGGGVKVDGGSFFARNTAFGSAGTGNVAGIELEDQGENQSLAVNFGNGGAISLSNAALATLVGGSVSGNVAASNGGGVWKSTDSRLFISGTQLTENIAQGEAADEGGGAIYNAGGTLIVANNSEISDNSATGEAGSGGGIFSVAGDVTVTDSEISANVANRAGGGIELIDGRLVFRRSVLGGSSVDQANVAGPEGTASPGNGGGLHISGDAARSFIQDSTVRFNVAASEGGGLWNQAGSFLRVDGGSVIADNVALGDSVDNGGGGIFNNGGQVTVLFSTITGNSAQGTSGSGGGVFSTDGNIFVSGSRVELNRANRAGGGFEIVDGRLDVLLTTVRANDAGTLGVASPGNGGGLHVTGNAARAVFRNSLISENTAASEGGGLWNQAGSTLLIDGSTVRSNSAVGDDADNGGGGIFNNGGDVLLQDSFVIDNSALGVAGSGGGLLSTNGSVTVTNTNISRNRALRAGGGIEIIDGATRLDNAILNLNVAGGQGANPGSGGAIHVSGNNSRLAIVDSFFASNVAANQGGALWNQTESLIFLGGTNVFTGNVAQTGGGGGIYNRGRLLGQNAIINFGTALDGGGVFTTSTGSTFLSQLALQGNFARNTGGGIANEGVLAITDSVFENNSASDGGAIADLDGFTTQRRNTFSGNSPNDVA